MEAVKEKKASSSHEAGRSRGTVSLNLLGVSHIPTPFHFEFVHQPTKRLCSTSFPDSFSFFFRGVQVRPKASELWAAALATAGG